MKRAFPIFAVLTAVLLSYALYEALVAAPTEQTMGNVQRIFYYHVPSAWTAFLLFFVNFVCSIQYLVRRDRVADKIANWVVIVIGVAACMAAFVIRPLPAGIEPSSVATTGLAITGLYFLIKKYFPGERTDALAVVTAEVGVVFCTRGAGDRAAVGASGVGNLVDLGCAPDFNPGALADLHQLPDAAPLFDQRPDAGAGRCSGNFRRARCPAGLLLHLDIPHPASSARDRRRRFDRSPHVARVADQLAGIPVFCRR